MPAIPTPFNANDDGTADLEVLAALQSGDLAAIVEALRESRLFVGVVSLLVSRDESGVEKESEMALAVLEHEGAQVLPSFTSIESLTKWRSDARPVAVIAEAAGLQVISDGMAGLLIDPPDDHAALVTISALRALILGYPMVPFDQDPAVLAVLESAVGQEPMAATAWMEPSEGVDATITVLIPDLPAEEARPIAERIAERVAADEQVRLRIEHGIDVQVVAAR